MGCELIVVATHVSIDIITLVVKVVTHTECIPAKNPVDGEHGTSIHSEDRATEERTLGKAKSVIWRRLHLKGEPLGESGQAAQPCAGNECTLAKVLITDGRGDLRQVTAQLDWNRQQKVLTSPQQKMV